MSNWAIAVHDDFLIFASHVEMIQEAIVQGAENKISPLYETEDYKRIVAALEQYFGKSDACGWRILRPKQAYRVNYELFRKGDLRRSKSMIANLLDRLLKNNDELQDKDQKISGEGLPDFQDIEKYLQPGGFRIRNHGQRLEVRRYDLGQKKNGK